MQFEEKILKSFQDRYKHVHPLLFWRSLEKAKTPGDLFDILEGIPQTYPFKWSNEYHKWDQCKQIPEK